MCFLLIFGSKNSFSFPNITSNIPNNINNSPNSQNNIDYCQNTKIYHPFIFEEIKKGNNEILAQIPNCFKSDRKLFLQLVKIDFSFFSEANEELQQDLNFIKKLVKINPKILQFCAPEVKKDGHFMEEMTYIYRDALRYASWSLLDNKPFMTKMIDLDSQNYKYGSDRIRSIKSIAQDVIKDNGMMLKFANFSLKNDEDFVREAIQSDSASLQFASKRIRNDINFIKLAEDENSKIDQEKIKKFINKHYFIADSKKNLPDKIANQAKFHENKIIFNHHYLTKWQKKFQEIDPIYRNYVEEWRLVGVDNRNYQTNFKTDLQAFPKLVEKIVNFLKKHRIDDNTIDNLKTTFLWKISDKPLTFAFNIYLIRDSLDQELGPQYASVTSLTAIVSDTSKPITIDEKNQLSTNNKLTVDNNSSLKNLNKNQQLTITKNIENEKIINDSSDLDLASDNDDEDNENDEDDDNDEINKTLTDEENQQDEELIDDNSKNKKMPKIKDDKSDNSSKNSKNNIDKSSKDKKSSTKNNSKSAKKNIDKNSSKKIPKILENPNAKWNLSVIETIFDSEIKMSETFKNGHKKYVLWDLFKTSKTDKNPLLIFLVEDEFYDYLEIYARQKNHKYKLIFDSKDKS